MRAVHVSVALFLGACTTGADRTALLNSLIGQPAEAVVRQLGVPTRTFETSGRTFLAYDDQRTSTFYGGSYFGGPVFAGGFGGGGWGSSFGYSAFPAEIVARQCETTFEIADKHVLTWSLHGNACG